MLHDALPEGGRSLVVGKSTVPVGTAQQVAERLAGRALVLWNPEFLREGFAVADTLHPDRIVYGVPADPRDAQEAQTALDAVYQDLLEEGIPQDRHRLPHRRAGQDRGELLPGHQDQLHQRHGPPV